MFWASHHDYFYPLGHRVGLVVLLFCQHMGKVAELPDWAALATLPGELYVQACMKAHRDHLHILFSSVVF